MEYLVIVCAGGCGKTTESVSPRAFWAGEIKEAADPQNLVPEWTCKECVAKRAGGIHGQKDNTND